MSGFAQEVDDLVAIAGELADDAEVLAACVALRGVAAEADDVDRRFREAMEAVQQLLRSRLALVR